MNQTVIIFHFEFNQSVGNFSLFKGIQIIFEQFLGAIFQLFLLF